VIFVDTNVFMYAVGGPHPLRSEARVFFETSLKSGHALVTSAEVLQEFLHAYLPVGRGSTLDAALALVDGCVERIWPVEAGDVRLARALATEHDSLGARDLIHLACCQRRGVAELRTFDRALTAALNRAPPPKR
jgi:uncharacterized protein